MSVYKRILCWSFFVWSLMKTFKYLTIPEHIHYFGERRFLWHCTTKKKKKEKKRKITATTAKNLYTWLIKKLLCKSRFSAKRTYFEKKIVWKMTQCSPFLAENLLTLLKYCSSVDLETILEHLCTSTFGTK